MATPFERSATPQITFSDPSLVESDADKSFSQSTLRQTSLKQLTSNDTAIMQREREIEDIAKGIIELADIFRDLQTMVIDQGTMLDRIDYNVERMAVDVKAADKELIVVCSWPQLLNSFNAESMFSPGHWPSYIFATNKLTLDLTNERHPVINAAPPSAR